MLHTAILKIKWFFQRLFRGWSDNEVWDLHYWIAKRYLPALIKLRAEHSGYPTNLTDEKWDNILDRMIFSFDAIVNHSCDFEYEKSYNDDIQKGCELFGKYFRNLWD